MINLNNQSNFSKVKINNNRYKKLSGWYKKNVRWNNGLIRSWIRLWNIRLNTLKW